jgi:hypothetical protein
MMYIIWQRILLLVSNIWREIDINYIRNVVFIKNIPLPMTTKCEQVPIAAYTM